MPCTKRIILISQLKEPNQKSNKEFKYGTSQTSSGENTHTHGGKKKGKTTWIDNKRRRREESISISQLTGANSLPDRCPCIPPSLRWDKVWAPPTGRTAAIILKQKFQTYNAHYTNTIFHSNMDKMLSIVDNVLIGSLIKLWSSHRFKSPHRVTICAAKKDQMVLQPEWRNMIVERWIWKEQNWSWAPSRTWNYISSQ
jgi:hypothetical protein